MPVNRGDGAGISFISLIVSGRAWVWRQTRQRRVDEAKAEEDFVDSTLFNTLSSPDTGARVGDGSTSLDAAAAQGSQKERLNSRA